MLTGIMPEMFKIIASELNITWSMHRAKDGFFGTTTQDGAWNGLIGELYRDEIDLGLAALTVTKDRMQVSILV